MTAAIITYMPDHGDSATFGIARRYPGMRAAHALIDHVRSELLQSPLEAEVIPEVPVFSKFARPSGTDDLPIG